MRRSKSTSGLSSAKSVSQAGAWRGHEPPSPRRMPTLPTNRKSLSALAQRASLIFAGRNLAEESGAGQADAAQAASRSESVSGDSSPASRGPRGGSAARFRLRQEAPAGQAAFQTSENPQQIGAFVASRPAPSGFFPILPADVSAVASSGEVFRSLGSRTDPVLHVRFPAPWSVVAENPKNQNWRCLLNLVRTAVLGPE